MMLKKLVMLCLAISEVSLLPVYSHSGDSWILEDESGMTTEEIKPDLLFKDRMRIYGKDGRYKGEIRSDPLFKDRMRVYDSDGNYKGEIRPAPCINTIRPDRQRAIRSDTEENGLNRSPGIENCWLCSR